MANRFLRPVEAVLRVYDVKTGELRAVANNHTLDGSFAQLDDRLATALQILLIAAGKGNIQCRKRL